MIFKLRHYVPLSILKLIYYRYCTFHSVLQYSLINWGRALSFFAKVLRAYDQTFLELVQCFSVYQKAIAICWSVAGYTNFTAIILFESNRVNSPIITFIVFFALKFPTEHVLYLLLVTHNRMFKV